MDDSGLAVQAAAGDHAAFEALLDRYGGRILAMATRIAGERSRGEDFCQEVFLHLLKVLGRYDPTRPFAPWLMRVATNVCRNRLRTERRRPAVSLDRISERAGDFLVGDDAGPEERAGRLDDLARLRAARDRLPDGYRTILALRYEAGLSHEQISDALGDLPIGTVKNRLFRARAALAKRLEDREETS